MTEVSSVTVVDSFTQDSMETVTAIQTENTTASHGRVHKCCHSSDTHSHTTEWHRDSTLVKINVKETDFSRLKGLTGETDKNKFTP